MFPRSSQAPCRLNARRRLALGGLAVTSALVAGAFVSTPASADAPTAVSSFADLHSALANHDASIKLTQSLDTYDAQTATQTADAETIAASTTIDLNGFNLSTDQIVVDPGVELAVTDSTANADNGPTANLNVSAPATGAATTAVQLAGNSTLHVTNVIANVIGNSGGAGIGGSDASAQFVADGSAEVFSHGTDDAVHGGGAGIGGAAGQQGIHVTVADSAQVAGYGGMGAAGVGGGYGGAGGVVHIASGALQAHQGDSVAGAPSSASSVGAGEDATALGFGSLVIDGNGSLALDSDSPLVLPSGAIVQNAGSLLLNPGASSSGHAVQGAGAIQNTGTIDTRNADGSFLDPAALIDSTVKVTGNNYDLAVDLNGGSVQDYQGAAVAVPATRHLLSGKLSDLLGGGSSVQAPSAASVFWRWTTDAGTQVDDALAVAGSSSDGTPVAVHLTAQFARVPVATATSLPSATVGTPYSAALPVSGDALNDYEVSYGNSSSSHVPGLPDGLTIDSSTGVISGTPTEAVNRDVTFYVGGPVTGADLTYHLTVSPAAVVQAPQAPVLRAIPTRTVKLGHVLTIPLQATGDQPVTYSVTSGSLPKGITLNGSTGLIRGVAGQSGTFAVVVTAKNAAGSFPIPITIVVPEPTALISTANHVPAVKVGAATVPLKVSGLKKGEHWTVKVDGKVVERGTMKRAGSLAVSVHLKKSLRDRVHTITIAGSRRVTDPSTRAATTVTITTLAARKALKMSSIAVNGVEQVVITKLAAGEQVVVKDGTRVIASGHATASGTFAFPQSKAGKGTSKLTVHGADAKRAGTLTVKSPKH